MQTVLAFLFAIVLLIAVHECGHFFVARACRVRVLRFSIGFGPVVWRRVSPRSGVEYCLSAIPLGGYVRMLDEQEAPVPAELQPLAFNRQVLWKRAAIVAAGPIANIVLAWLLFSMVAWMGQESIQAVMPTPMTDSAAAKAGFQAGDLVVGIDAGEGVEVEPVVSLDALRWSLTKAVLADQEELRIVVHPEGNANQTVERTLTITAGKSGISNGRVLQSLGWVGWYAAPIVREVVAGSPAQLAGLQAGDEVVQVDGIPVRDAAQLIQRIRAGNAQPQLWLVRRGSGTQSITVQARWEQVGEQSIPRIGAALGAEPEVITVRYGVWDGLTNSATHMAEAVTMTVRGIWALVTGEVTWRSLNGPITIADYAGKAAKIGWSEYVGFMAMISISLGVMNLLPLPVLDGGHLLFYLCEAIGRRPLPVVVLEYLQRAGVALLLLMMCVAMYNDVLRLIN